MLQLASPPAVSSPKCIRTYERPKTSHMISSHHSYLCPVGESFDGDTLAALMFLACSWDGDSTTVYVRNIDRV